ncbi:MAG: hypothetical protein NTV93_13300 [Verrucomicrobia bacterium]|nr:hypothetical protein [Verrucomicrobiota bacterium]
MIEYGTAPLPDATKVVNPAWRKLDQAVRRESAKLKNLQSQLVSRTLPMKADEEKARRFERETGALLLEIKAKEVQLETDKQSRKTTTRRPLARAPNPALCRRSHPRPIGSNPHCSPARPEQPHP